MPIVAPKVNKDQLFMLANAAQTKRQTRVEEPINFKAPEYSKPTKLANTIT